MEGKIRVLIADNSAIARSRLRSMFESDPAFEVVAEAKSGREAVDLVSAHPPDLVTMDLEMTEMGGLEAIEHIMDSRPVPILVVSDSASAQNVYAAISRGAVDTVAKPGMIKAEIRSFLDKSKLVATVPVITHVRAHRSRLAAAADADTRLRTPHVPGIGTSEPSPVCQHPADRGRLGGLDALSPVFAIASSIGGPRALAHILRNLPPTFACPILVAQHLSPGFSAEMARWLATVSRLPVKLADEGESILPGVVYLSPSEAHMTIAAGYHIAFIPIQSADIYRPSCNALLESVAAVFGRRSIGIVLTGMGNDGVRGMERIKAAEGLTIAQDKASSVVFGMNQVAIDHGWIEQVLPLEEIPAAMIRLAELRRGTQNK